MWGRPRNKVVVFSIHVSVILMFSTPMSTPPDPQCIVVSSHIRVQAHNQMEQYAEVIGSDATKEDYLRIASHFQRTGENFKAGQFFLRAKDYAKVCNHYFKILCVHVCTLAQLFYTEGGGPEIPPPKPTICKPVIIT